MPASLTKNTRNPERASPSGRPTGPVVTASSPASLVTAFRSAPNEVRYRPDALELVSEVVRRAGSSVPGMRELADQLGLSGGMD